MVDVSFACSKIAVTETEHPMVSMRMLYFHLAVILGAAICGFFQLSIPAAIFDFLMMFLVVGQSLRIGLIRTFASKLEEMNQNVILVFDILLSAFTTVVVSIIFGSLGFVSFIVAAILLVTIICDLIHLTVSDRSVEEEDTTQSRFDYGFDLKHFGPIVVSFLIGILILIWRFSYLEWPESSGTDLFFHVAATRLIARDGGSPFIFHTYPYLFHTFSAAIVVHSGIDPYFLLAYGPLIVYPLVFILIYQFTFSIVGHRVKSLLVVALFGFVNECGALLGPHFLFPSTYAYAILLLLFMFALGGASSRINLLFSILFLISTVFVYPAVVLVAAPGLILMWCLRSSQRIALIVQKLFLLGIATAIAILPIFYLLLPLLGLNIDGVVLGLPILVISSTLSRQLSLLLYAYSIPMLILFGLGTLMLLMGIRKDTPQLKSANEDRFVFLYTTFIFTVFLLPFQFGHRVEMYIRSLIFLSIVVSITKSSCFLAARLQKVCSVSESWLFKRLPEFFVLIILVGTIAPSVIMMDVALRYEPHNPSLDEYEAFKWLSENLGIDDYVLTDPATGYLMRAFLLRNCSTSLIEGGNVRSPRYDPTLCNLTFDYFNSTSEDESDTFASIVARVGEVSFIVISPRTTAWLAQERLGRDGLYSVYNQQIWSGDPSWDKFTDPQYITVIEFGSLRILTRQDIVMHFYDPFDNASLWAVSSGLPAQVESGVMCFSNDFHPTAWFHLYTNAVSMGSSSDVYIRFRYTGNSSQLEGRIFGYPEDERTGNYTFYTEFISPSTFWRTGTWKVTDCAFYQESDLESLSIGVHNVNESWMLYIDYIQVFSLVAI